MRRSRHRFLLSFVQIRSIRRAGGAKRNPPRRPRTTGGLRYAPPALRLTHSSAAGDRVAIADTLRQPRLAPALAAVTCPEHLPRFRYGIDLRRIARMRRDAHHRVVRLDAVVKTLPAPADIVALVERAVGAAEG